MIIEFCACDSVIFIFAFLHFAYTLEMLHGIYIRVIRSAYDIFFALFCQQFGTNSQFVPAVENFLLDMLFKFEFELLWFDHLTLFSER